MSKIKEIYFNYYRAFFGLSQNNQQEDKPTLSTEGNKTNFLIYGENGSGKSSVFKGIQQFFESSEKPSLDFPINYFVEGELGDENPYIKVVLEDNTELFFTPKEEKNTAQTNSLIKEGYKSSGFLSYRELLKVHFVESDVNLFGLLIGTKERQGILYQIENEIKEEAGTDLSKKPIGELFSNLRNAEFYDKNDKSNVLKDFNIGLKAILENLKKQLNELLKQFDTSFKVERFEFEDIKNNDLSKVTFLGKIKPVIKFQNKEIKDFHNFLNEARLTSLAICMYLAALLKLPSTSEANKVLFLDDVFIGLDMSNRLPLLTILNDYFQDYQLFLTTYDKVFFELAKRKLPNTKWKATEMYVGIENFNGNNYNKPIILDSLNYYEKAKEHFEVFDYPACANYLRKECERLIKDFLPKNLQLMEDSNTGKITEIHTLGNLFDNLVKFLEKNKLDISEFKNFKDYQKVVLNALSHDDLKSPVYRKELEDSFKLVEELKKLNSKKVFESNDILLVEIIIPKDKSNEEKSYSYEIHLIENLYLLKQEDKAVYSKSVCNAFDVNNKKIYWKKKSLHEIFKNIIHSLSKNHPEYYKLDFDYTVWFSQLQKR